MQDRWKERETAAGKFNVYVNTEWAACTCKIYCLLVGANVLLVRYVYACAASVKIEFSSR